MKKLNSLFLILLCTLLLSSCGRTFIVWNGSDVIGFFFFGLIMFFLIMVVLTMWVGKKWKELKEWWNKK